MIIRIDNATILDSHSSFHNQKKNLIIEDGIIKNISDNQEKADTVIQGNNLMVSPGWVDMRVTIGDPGLEHKEDIKSISTAAAFGGFTEILCMPGTKPAIHTKDVIGYIKGKAREELVDIHLAACVTHDRLGKDMTEMIDLHHAGALAFTDGDKPIWHTDILLKSLQYLQTFDGLLIDHAEELTLTHSGQMNEGINSTRLGLKGIPKLSEDIIVERNLNILSYSGGRIHFAHISSPQSIEKIRKAKQAGLKVTCDIAAYNLVLDDSLLHTFDTGYKVNPPLRDREDVNYFWRALEEGVIDVIVSDHVPLDEESKNTEFDLAEFGMIGIETVFPILLLHEHNKLKMDVLLEKLCYNPRKILKLPVPVVKEGELANLTIFDPSHRWTYHAKDVKSKSKNSPFIGNEFTGKVIAVFNKGKFKVN